MARKSSTKTTENPTEQIMNAINTPVNLEWSATAQKLNIPVPELQERVSTKLNDSTVFAWDNLPVEHEPLVEAIQRDLESENSVRRLTPEAQPEVVEQETVSVAEIPLLPEEPKSKKGRGGGKLANRGKKASTALTNKKSEEIEQIRNDSAQISDGIAETLIEFTAQEGLQDSSNAATAYVAAFKTNLDNKKGEGALSIATEILIRTADKKNFTPNEVLERLGVPLSSETLQDLNENLAEISGELDGATTEIAASSWGNGNSPKDALTRLRELRKLNG